MNNVWEENMYAFDYILYSYLLYSTLMLQHSLCISWLIYKLWHANYFGPRNKYRQQVIQVWMCLRIQLPLIIVIWDRFRKNKCLYLTRKSKNIKNSRIIVNGLICIFIVFIYTFLCIL